MGTFLQILGAIFLFLIVSALISVLVAKFWVKRRLEKMAEHLQEQVRKSENTHIYEYEDLLDDQDSNDVS